MTKIDGLEIVMTKHIKSEIDKELKKRFEELKPDIAKRYEELLNMRNMETDQFNDGFNDARAGKLETDHPHYDFDTDNWRLGYAWGMFEPMKEKLARERQASDALYLLLVDDPNTKLLADQILINIFGKCEPSPSDVSVTQDVLTDVKTGQSIENTNPDYYKQEIDRLNAELLELNDKAVFIEFENEDELPAEIKDDVYSAMFECSHVDGVRLFPYIEENGQKYFLVMIEEENKSRLVYIVTMYRYGDREKHSYVLGAFSTENDARECGEKEKDYRGGKYEPEIIKFYVDSQRIDDFVGDSDHEHDDRIL